MSGDSIWMETRNIAQKYFERSLDRFLKDVYELDEPLKFKTEKILYAGVCPIPDRKAI